MSVYVSVSVSARVSVSVSARVSVSFEYIKQQMRMKAKSQCQCMLSLYQAPLCVHDLCQVLNKSVVKVPGHDSSCNVYMCFYTYIYIYI